MIYITYTFFEDQLEKEQFQNYLSILPSDMQARANRYIRWQDAQAFLLGKLLLIKGLNHFGLDGKALLHQIQYTTYNRPYLAGEIDFNISHSEGCIVCAVTEQGRLGVDVEKVRPLELSSFKRQMTELEWDNVMTAEDPQGAFLDYWTKKEAAIKAHGQGMSLGLKEIKIDHQKMWMEGKAWPLYEVSLHPDYICHLVTDSSLSPSLINLHRVSFSD